jgi:hypothetical protein
MGIHGDLLFVIRYHRASNSSSDISTVLSRRKNILLLTSLPDFMLNNPTLNLMMNHMRRILITAGGVLGSHLCERLLQEGHDIICLDNFFTGDKNNIIHLIGHPRFELIGMT